MEQCIQNMTSEVVELKKKAMEADLTEENFQASEEKTKLYTVISNFPILKANYKHMLSLHFLRII